MPGPSRSVIGVHRKGDRDGQELSVVSRFAPINADCAPLKARTTTRLALLYIHWQEFPNMMMWQSQLMHEFFNSSILHTPLTSLLQRFI